VHTSRRAIAALTFTASLFIAACGGSDSTATDSTVNDAEPSAAPTEQADQEFNDDDVMFAQGMIPHHAQAVEMASIALEPDRATSDQVRDLAQRIQSAQDPEIEQMTEWLTS